MIIGEIKPGLPIKCYFEGINPEMSGEERDAGSPGLADLIVVCSANGDTPSTMTGATCTFNTIMDQWLLEADTSYIPEWGVLDIVIKSPDLVDFVNIRLGVNTADTKIDTIKTITDALTLDAIKSQMEISLTDYASPTKIELDMAFAEIKGVGWATETLKNIKDTQVTTNQISSETYSSITNAGLLAVPDTVTNIKTVTDLLSLANIKTQATSALTDYDAPTKAEFDAAIANLATKTDLESISITVDGSELITASTVLTLPSNKTITFADLIVGIYQYRKW